MQTPRKTNRPDTTEKLLAQLPGWEVPGLHDKTALWKKIEARTQNPAPSPRVLGLTPAYAAAASLAVLLVAFAVAWQFGQVSIYAKAGAQKEVLMPDSTLVVLNAESTLHYNKLAYRFRRNLQLSGEAWFEVKKGPEFTVSTAAGQVQVLGTSFNVYARQESFRTHCMTGKVSVTSGGQTVVLEPGQRGTIEGNTLSKAEFAPKQTPQGWKNGVFSYQDAPLEDVLHELARQFNVKIVINHLKNRHYTGTFTRNDLDSALTAICKPMGLSYQVTGQAIYVTQ